MLSHLHIKNYALIEDLQVDFNSGLTTITGETGAGKSILLGGLSLVLGKRIDLSNIKNPSKKSIIECVFQLEIYNLQSFFQTHDLEYEPETIIRREVLPSGKSRAFVNDSPVKLDLLQALGRRLVDIHSQHETLSLTQDAFQFQIIDALGKTTALVKDYSDFLSKNKALQKEITALELQKQQSKNEYDYHSFLRLELEDSKVLNLDFEALESDYNTLSNLEAVQSELEFASQSLNADDIGINAHLLALKQRFQKLGTISSKYHSISERLNSISIELHDISSDIDTELNSLDPDPNRLSNIETQLKKVHDLFNKHNVNSTDALNEVYKALQFKTAQLGDYEARLNALNISLNENTEKLKLTADKITKKRQAILPKLKSELEILLQQLGMPHSKFKINITPSESFLSNGKDCLSFLLQANKGGQFLALKKGASGGELSRIMLAVKFILSKHQQLPTIMFDEIDTGVSGEISNKMASIMQEMSRYMQVFTITHLPQIAAKGDAHFKVFKTEKNNSTITKLKPLSSEERLEEIAQMLGGLNLTASAKAHAKQLLN
ncbi:MAG: DNA repair protein RecN [Flavobacteriaceae bacterium]|nr:DNA repair protein RecN [Flavobacteriaceae bacterium]